MEKKDLLSLVNDVVGSKFKEWTAYAPAFWGAIISGILSHGYLMSNKISFHDDFGNINSIVQGYDYGRWTYSIINWFGNILWGGVFIQLHLMLFLQYSIWQFQQW